MTLKGGLWPASNTVGVNPRVRFALLLLADISDIGLLFVALRIRDVLENYFEAIRAFDATAFPRNASVPKLPGLGGYAMVTIYALILSSPAILFLVGALVFLRPLGWW